MRSFVALALAVVLAGCPKQTEVVKEPPPPPDPWPALTCPEGAKKVGGAPPVGFEVWCQIQLPNGQWQREGGAVAWHPNGTNASEGAYLQGKKHGPWQTWHDNSFLASSVTYENGAIFGPTVEYWPNGNKKAEGDRVDDKEAGPWTYWHENGQIWKTGAWKDGNPDGRWVEHAEDGTPERERVYFGGRMISQEEFKKP